MDFIKNRRWNKQWIQENIEKVAVGNRESFLKVRKLKDRLDEFYFSSVGGLDKSPQLCKVSKMVLTLFHGQASVEWGFNINKAMLQPNLMSKFLASQRLVYDHIKAHSSSAESVVITKQLRDFIKRTRNQQRLDLAERKKNPIMLENVTGCYCYRYKGVGGQEDRSWEFRKKLKTDSELLLIKAAENVKNAHRFAIEGEVLWRNMRKSLHR